MRCHLDTRAQMHMLPDYRVGTYDNPRLKLGALGDNGGLMNVDRTVRRLPGALAARVSPDIGLAPVRH